MKSDQDLIDGDGLRKQLEALLPESHKSIKMISAYITQSGVEWLKKYAPADKEVTIVCRLLPNDVITGSTQISALRTAIEAGFRLFCLHSLHAKIYSIDDDIIFSGSANLTNNGLKIYGEGNTEANVKIPPSKANLQFINMILENSTLLDIEALTRMQSCIDLKETEIYIDRWPEGVLKEAEGIWVRDFFWGAPVANESSIHQVHDLELMGAASFSEGTEVLRPQVLKARCVRWLIQHLTKAEGKELYFGALTQALHNDLKDDPTPYRKDVKTLLQNLFIYCEVYLPDVFEISRPNYSQKIKLKKCHL